MTTGGGNQWDPGDHPSTFSDPELQSRKPARKSTALPKHRREIKIWVTQPKLDLLESAIGQLCEREPRWRQVAEALAKEARLERLLKVLESFKQTDANKQQEIFDGIDY